MQPYGQRSLWLGEELETFDDNFLAGCMRRTEGATLFRSFPYVHGDMQVFFGKGMVWLSLHENASISTLF